VPFKGARCIERDRCNLGAVIDVDLERGHLIARSHPSAHGSGVCRLERRTLTGSRRGHGLKPRGSMITSSCIHTAGLVDEALFGDVPCAGIGGSRNWSFIRRRHKATVCSVVQSASSSDTLSYEHSKMLHASSQRPFESSTLVQPLLRVALHGESKNMHEAYGRSPQSEQSAPIAQRLSTLPAQTGDGGEKVAQAT
jgi:hypothetical protein